MKGPVKRAGGAAVIVYRALLALALLLAAVIIGGTVYGCLRGKGRPAQEAAAGNSEGIFSGIGTVRVSTAGDDGETVILSVAFPYNSADRPFAEELVARIPDFKKETAGYVGAFTSEELRNTDIAVINAELLKRYNALLHLGRIKELYFLEFIWL